MIKEILIDLDHRGAPTRPTVKSIIFFGAPHRGLEVTAMQSMVHGAPSENLIRELEMHSPTLQRLNDGFRRVYEGVNILTIYEMESTASLRRNEFDTWERTGPSVMMVEKHSAILYWPMETLIGLNQNHSRIAKVDRGQNGCYDDICHFLRKSLIPTTDKAPIGTPQPWQSPALSNSSRSKSVLERELCEAIKNGDSKTARDLLLLDEKGSLTQLRGNQLSRAIEHCPEVVSTLLDAGADISAKDDENGDQAIHIAGRFAKTPDIIQLLLDAGADVNAREHIHRRPLHFAAQYNSNSMIIKVLMDAGAVVNAFDFAARIPLHYAAKANRNSEIVQILIDAGAIVTASYNDKYTPLHLAASSNNNPKISQALMMQALIDTGAMVNVCNTDGRTPLHCAVANNNDPMVIRALIDAGANLNASDEHGTTPLHAAVSSTNNQMTIRMLIDAGADVNASNDNGYTPLLWAALENTSQGVVIALIEENADVNATDLFGDIPLMVSVTNENPEICRALLTARARPNYRNKKGDTALHRAVREGNQAVLSHLSEYGVDPRAKSEDGVAPTDQEFAENVPPVTRYEVGHLVTEATRPPKVKAQVDEPKGRWARRQGRLSKEYGS